MKTVILFGAAILVLALTLGCTQQVFSDTNSGSDLMDLTKNNLNTNDANSGLNIKNDINSNSNERLVKTGDNIEVNYVLKVNGEVIQSSIEAGQPLNVIVGETGLIKGFADALPGMKTGQTKIITVPPEQGYGQYDPTLLRTFDKNAYADFNKMRVGDYLIASTGQKFKVVEKNDTNFVVDLNPELAGKTLVFEITVVSFK